MSTLPLTEAILLEIHQSLGCEPFPTNKKDKFATGQSSLESHQAVLKEVLNAIFDGLDLDLDAREAVQANLLEFANAYKSIEENTWTFAADQRQILWALLNHFYVPGLARHVGFWSAGHALDKGMPAGRFWYLPEPRDLDGKSTLYLPIAQVVDWLLDLLGMPIEILADKQSESTHGGHEGLRRSLYNWRNATLIQPSSIDKYFSDKVQLDFGGCLSPEINRTPDQQFKDALEFVHRKGLTADKLRIEIPMTQPGRLEAILDDVSNTSEAEKATFVACLVERYSAPSMQTIRQRMVIARMVQDGYNRLLKVLCPDLDQQCADPRQNKLLQVFAIYKLVYNLTVEAWKSCHDQGEHAENHWFEENLPDLDKESLFLSILPSRRNTANMELAHWLTRYFFETREGDDLEDHVALDEQSKPELIQRKTERLNSFTDEIRSEMQLVVRMHKSSPWRALQGESRFWVVAQVARRLNLNQRSKQAALQRLRDLAITPAQTVQAILLELEEHLDGARQNRTKDTQVKVQGLLDEAQASKGYPLWEAAILHFKAKHLLASNDFDGAGRLFRMALESVLDRNYGLLRGEIAQDCLALAVANGKLVANNHEKYYREMLAGGIFSECRVPPPIEEAARLAYEYFWETLYKPYPGVQAEQPHTGEIASKMFRELLPLLISGETGELKQWIKTNHSLLKRSLPDVDGNSVLMSLTKLYIQFVERLPLMRLMDHPELHREIDRHETMMKHWRQFLGQLAKDSPKQLNMADIKGQTPLMLITQMGDVELLAIMLQAGADPDAQDRRGATALHSAAQLRWDGCVDVLLDHPCTLDKVKFDGHSPLHTATWAGHIHAVKRLSQLAPELAWLRDANGKTPLELAEFLVEHPDALEALAERLARDGKFCASKQELEAIAHILEQVPPVAEARLS